LEEGSTPIAENDSQETEGLQGENVGESQSETSSHRLPEDAVEEENSIIEPPLVKLANEDDSESDSSLQVHLTATGS
jgi:hypothetical protein